MKRIAILTMLMVGMTVSVFGQQKPTAPKVAPATHLKATVAPIVPGTNPAPEVDLSWGQPTSGCPCTYNMYRGATSGSEVVIATGIVVLTYNDTNVIRGNSYCYYVTAQAGSLESKPSNEQCVTSPVPPSAPTLNTPIVK